MICLSRLWIVTYKSDGKNLKARFCVYDNNGIKIYKISTGLDGSKERVVTKEEGNDYYKELMLNFKGKVNKIL